jgi:hypothetical protein
MKLPIPNNSLFRHPMPTAALALVASLSALPAHAVMFSFTGQIDEINGTSTLLPAEIVPGALFSGTFSFDPAQASLDGNFNPSLGNFTFSNPDGSDFSISLTLGGHTWASEASAVDSDRQVNVNNNTPEDRVEYQTFKLSYDGNPSLPNGITSASIALRFTDASGAALSSDAAPNLVPQLSVFSGGLFVNADDGGVNSVSFNATILSVTPVPEPGEWAVIMGGLLGGFAVVRRRRSASVR